MPKVVRNRNNFYHIDFEDIGRNNPFGGFTPPGDIDQVYHGWFKDRWLFGEIKMAGTPFSYGQQQHQVELMCDIRKMVILAQYYFEPQFLDEDNWVKLKYCTVERIFFKPNEARTGVWINLHDLGFTPQNLIEWADDRKNYRSLADFLEHYLIENNISFNY